jgi:Secretion system C-terminal sorting domain
MKKNLLLILWAVIGLCLGGAALAQQQKPNEEQLNQLTARLVDKLQLNPTQAEQLKTIHQKYLPQIRSSIQENNVDVSASRQRVKNIRKEMQAEIKSILSEEQWENYLMLRKQFRGKMLKMASKTKFAKGKLRQEIKEYMERNVMPVVKQHRVEFESQLSDTDKAIIANSRDEFKKYKAQIKAIHQQIRSERENGNWDRDAYFNQLKELRQTFKPKLEEMKKLAKKYDTQLQIVREKIAENEKKWTEDIHEIIGKYILDEEIKSKLNHKHIKYLRKSGIGFLLLEANEAKPGINIYPNPVGSKHNIEFEISKAGKVQIDLIDKEGKIIRTILNEHKSSGKHIVEVDVAQLSTDVYYYQILLPEGKIIKRLLVQK